MGVVVVRGAVGRGGASKPGGGFGQMEQITSGTRALPKLKVISGLPSKESGTREASCPRRSPDSVTLAPLESALTSGAMCNLGVSHLSLCFFFLFPGGQNCRSE